MHSRDVFFPQRCSHLACAFNTSGELRVAMASADRLLFLREGTLFASGPLFDDQKARPAGRGDAAGDTTLRQLRFCHFSDDMRVAVVGARGVTVVDVCEGEMRLKYRQVPNGNHLGAAAAGLGAYSLYSSAVSAPLQGAPDFFAAPRWLTGWDASVGHEEVREAVDAEFIALSTLAIVFSDGAVVVDLGADGDTVKWRMWGSYSALAVCRTNMHLAFALHASAVEVFPLKGRPRYGGVSPPSPPPEEKEPSLLYSPSRRTASLTSKDAVQSDKFALRGVSARLGLCKVTTIEWHHIASHTILCVTCQDPHDGQLSVALFSVQFIPDVGAATRGKVAEAIAPADYSTKRRTSDHTLQLVLSGTVSLRAMSSSLRPQLVPSFSRSRDTTSLSNKLEFLCFDADGTVRTVCYRFGQQKQGGLPKQRSAGQRATKLLLPLQDKYGDIVRVEALPIWKSRAVDIGALTPQAEQLLRARRYRLVAHFANGMVAKVMLDLITRVVRVEAFLTLGVDPLPLQLSTSRGADGEVLLLGLSHERAFVIEQATRNHGVVEATLLAVSPIPVELRQRMQASQTCAATTPAAVVAAAGDTGDVKEAAVKLFMEAKCPEKVCMVPSLLKACGGDAGRLLTQLTARYGPLEPPVAPHTKNYESSDPGSALDARGSLLPASASACSYLSLQAGFGLQQVQTTVEGFCCSTRHAINNKEAWWCIPGALLESFAAAQGELRVPTARVPATAPLQLLTAAPVEGCCHSDKSAVKCEWVEGINRITVRATSLPDDPPLSFQPFASVTRYCVEEAKAIRLANECIVVGVMGTLYDAEAKRVLWLYGLDLLRNVAVPPVFVVELQVDDVVSFALSYDAEAFTLRRHRRGTIERWVRAMTGGEDGCHWGAAPVLGQAGWQGDITAMAPVWVGDAGSSSGGNTQVAHLLFSSVEGAFIHAWSPESTPLETSLQPRPGNFSCEAVVEVYNPTTLLALLGMGRWRMVKSVLEDVLQLARARAADEVVAAAEDTNDPRILAREFCHNPVSIRLCEQSSVAHEDVDTAILATTVAASLDRGAQTRRLLEQDERGADNTSLGSEFPADMLEEVMEQLSLVRLSGLSSQEQLGLVCVVDAMRAVILSTVGMDAEASRFFFIHKLHQLCRRLGVRETLASILLNPHNAFLWAALSDAQPQLLDELLGKGGAVSWAEVEAAGVPFWMKSLPGLRSLAERVARGQYQATKDVRECALMYVLAGKVGVLAALCKAEQNAKLHAFFLRNFNEAKNKAAASSNAFAAVSKNMVSYGAAFFLLAGEPRNAAQVLLQRQGSIALALLVLRLASSDDLDDLLWFMEQRRREEATCGPMNVWEEACLLWRCGQPREARLRLACHIPQCVMEAAEILGLLRDERRRVRSESLAPLRELLLQMHLTHLSHATGMQLLAIMGCREAQTLLAQVRSAKEEETIQAAARRTVAARTKADFNTGTLTFRGFDMDDDDDDAQGAGGESNIPAAFSSLTSADIVQVGCTSSASDEAAAGQLDLVAAVALEKELQWTEQRLCGTVAVDTWTEPSDSGRGALHALVVCTARMVVDAVRRAPVTIVEDRLAGFLEALLASRKSRVEPSSGKLFSVPVLGSVAARLVIVAVRLVLLFVALQNTDYALTTALLGFPTVGGVLNEQHAETATLDSVLLYVRGLQAVLSRVRVMASERPKQDETEAAATPSAIEVLLHTESDSDAVLQAKLHEEKLRALLLLWGAAFLQLCALGELREEVHRIRDVLANFSRPPQYAQLLLWLLGCLLCRTTLAFNAAASQLIGHVVAVRHLDDSILTNSNGIFIEEEQELLRVAELLENNLLADSDDTDLPLPLQTVSLDICVARSEFFWQLPRTTAKISADTDNVVRLLREATHAHATAHILYDQLSDGAVATLRSMEVAWLRRSLTHASFREFMLEAGLCGGLAEITTTDRLVLHQSYCSICSVDYDRFSCDSLVWGTDAGAEVGHNYREILAGDNEAAFLRDKPGRNIVTAALSAGLSGERGAGTVTPRSAHVPVQRPRLSHAAHAQVASHPHLPFFLTRHNDGCVDLYSFTSTECVATFLCHGSHVVTDIAYSPNGYMFAAGLADGTVAGWRFDLSTPSDVPLFVHRLLPPEGVKAALFFENQQSLLLVAGFEYAKEESLVGKATKGRRSSGGNSHKRCTNDRARRVVGVILVVDLLLEGGTLVARRELPFVPEYAVRLTGLDLVLCVAVDGRMLLFDVWKSHLYILGDSPHIAVSCVAVSSHDDVLAIGTEDGHALLLRFRTLLEVMKAACLEEVTPYATAVTYAVEENILHRAARLQLAPVLRSHSGVSCMVFAPSVLLAGLKDGKLVAAMLVPHALREGTSLPP
ncbi:hypothetical protein TraAM80_06350 [Trypanosoma rangeli]|uniref:RAVE complex protein Rav1 C-terminal domain-containing protein n=1 Tax=Trypanosoma rangeli TaxID=5698 RepID=A0A422NAN7_TRYRA|nr:uncharacterized protein TraAM80_06350 [Trypanosoma rangeli]RNF02525.1 hypothetical protein TraAM80_06350 [Trypanosoma rangeli]|eukprot:RNF02525.1 hypothetical protein TraAM80_06350 [Trypanosoma rangeli]